MNKILTTAINGYDQVIKGKKCGRDYLLEFMQAHDINDDEILYLIYAAADIAQQRPKKKNTQNCGKKRRVFPIVN